jgi:poly(U)-binding-splicing factor PUF60
LVSLLRKDFIVAFGFMHSNVRSEVSADELKAIFQSFGTIIECDFICPPIPSVQKSDILVRIGEICFSKSEAATEAAKSMNNFELGGCKLKIEVIEDSASQISSVAAKAAQSAALALASKLSSAVANKVSSATASEPSATARTSLSGTSSSLLGSHPGSDHHPEGTSSAQSPAQEPPAPSVAAPVARKVLLENMVSVDEINDPELKEEITAEAGKYGTVEKLTIGLNDAGVVTVSLLFKDGESAQNAHKAMDGRFFGGKQIKSRLSTDL